MGYPMMTEKRMSNLSAQLMEAANRRMGTRAQHHYCIPAQLCVKPGK
jgi:hypothetical protein